MGLEDDSFPFGVQFGPIFNGTWMSQEVRIKGERISGLLFFAPKEYPIDT